MPALNPSRIASSLPDGFPLLPIHRLLPLLLVPNPESSRLLLEGGEACSPGSIFVSQLPVNAACTTSSTVAVFVVVLAAARLASLGVQVLGRGVIGQLVDLVVLEFVVFVEVLGTLEVGWTTAFEILVED